MSDRARQKKAEKHNKKRAEAQKKARAAAVPPSDASIVRAAARWPVVGAWLAGKFRDEKDVALVTAIIARGAPDGRLVMATALVDRTCLGVKDGFARPLSEDDLDDVLETFRDSHGALEELDVVYVRSLVFHAIDYAAALGFSPHRDFAADLFGPRPETLIDTPWYRRSRPLYIAGPHDDVDGNIERLDARLGPNGYDLFVPHEYSTDGEHDSDEDEQDLRSLGPAAQMAAFVEPLLAESDRSIEATKIAIELGSALWNIALESDAEGQRTIDALEQDVPEEGRALFRQVAETMVARHRAMFPEMHDRRAR